MAEFTAIVGDRGSGKTNLLTAMLYRAHLKGRKIIANYHLSFPHVYMPFPQIAEFGPEIADCDIGLDELGRGADSYEWMTSQSKKITNVVLQIRKRHCEAIYTVQRFRLINNRLRDQTDGFLLMDDLDGKKRSYTDPRTGRLVEVENHREICKGRFNVDIYNADYRFVKNRKFDGRPYWNMYDTDEEISNYDDDDSGVLVFPDWEKS